MATAGPPDRTDAGGLLPQRQAEGFSATKCTYTPACKS
jgi:hypothetical protein